MVPGVQTSGELMPPATPSTGPIPTATEQVTVVVPFGKNEPDAGVHVAVNEPGQLSVIVGAG